jgi:branched-chain amino acid transport system ATP-binding protein
MLTMARTLAAEPACVLADEVSLGLAPLIVDRLFRAIRAAADTGTAVILVEQQLHRALEVADRAYVMARGRIALSGTVAEVRSRLSEVEDLYVAAGDKAAETPRTVDRKAGPWPS